MAQVRGAIATGNRARGTIACLKEMPWSVLIVLILVLIVILAMWGKLPHWERRPSQAPTGKFISLGVASPSSPIVSA